MMALNQLGSPLPGATHYHDIDDVDDDMSDRMSRNCPRVHPWCSVEDCTERPLRQFMASSSKQVLLIGIVLSPHCVYCLSLCCQWLIMGTKLQTILACVAAVIDY